MNWPGWLLNLFRHRPKPVPIPAPPPIPGPSPPSTGLVAQLNAARAQHGVSPVSEDPRATAAAIEQAVRQAARDQIGHDGPPGHETEVQRLAAAGIVNRACGEITAEGPGAAWGYTFASAIESWLMSPGHRAIMLDSQYTIAGAATATAASGNLYSTVVFIR